MNRPTSIINFNRSHQPILKLLILRLLMLLAAFLSFVFCYAQKQEGYIVLSGKIENAPATPNGKKTIELSYPFYVKDKPKKIIPLEYDGSFRDTIDGANGLYYIFDYHNVVPVYMKRSKQYSISYNADDFRNGRVMLAGSDTSVNRYFVEKMQQREFVDRLNIKRPEEEFRKEIGNIRQKQFTRLNNAKLPKALKQEETRNIQYEYLSELFFFHELKRQSDHLFKPLSISEKELNIDYNNVEEYKRQAYYSKLVDMYYSKALFRLAADIKKTDTSYSETQNRIRLLNEVVPDSYIKNDLIKQNAAFHLKESKDKDAFYNDFKTYYTGADSLLISEMEDAYMRFSKLKQGTLSPQFYNYKNYNGGSNSLKDFKGKYVFIDIWATWCLNCWEEFPYLKKLEDKYKDKNIVFVSLSCDRFEKEWRNAIKKEKPGGIQLLADEREDSFFKAYAVSGIPRYILLDPDGRIIDYNAPRPSDQEALKKLFEEQGL